MNCNDLCELSDLIRDREHKHFTSGEAAYIAEYGSKITVNPPDCTSSPEGQATRLSDEETVDIEGYVCFCIEE